MPNFDSFDGIKINIYNGDHLPPHIHALYGDDEVLLVIETIAIYAGYLPAKKLNPQLYACNKKTTKNPKRKNS
jgi:hypothetical protein